MKQHTPFCVNLQEHLEDEGLFGINAVPAECADTAWRTSGGEQPHALG
ncbi:hypothetical protein ABIA16_004570 [Sinorhizobium fredii]